MMYPGDANLILLQVDNPDSADVVVYKTEDKKEAQEWDFKWKFKKWGFSNFSVYITRDPNDSLLYDEETGIKYAIQGKIYFTDNPDEVGIKNENFHMEGVLIKNKKLKKDEDDEKDKDK